MKSLAAIVILVIGAGLAGLGLLVLGAAQSVMHEILAAVLVGNGAIVLGLGGVVAALEGPKRNESVDDAILDLAADVAWLKGQKSRELVAKAEAKRAAEARR